MKPLLWLLTLGVSFAAHAQEFPNKHIRLVVGFPAGGPSDIPARLIADKLRVSLGQPVVVENKTGAAGMIAANDVLAQPADGYTLLLCSYIDPLNTLLYKSVTYKVADLAPVSLVSKAYYAFAASADLPADLDGFIAYAKARPGVLNYGRVGAGSVTEMLPKQFEKLAGISMTGITFKGTGPALQEVVAGRVHFMVGPIALTLPLYQGKKLRILGITSPARLIVAPEVPTLSEQGLPIVNYGWWGVCARAGTPQPVIQRLNRDIVAAVGSPDYMNAMERAASVPVYSTPEEMGREIATTVTEYGRMIRELGIQQVD